MPCRLNRQAPRRDCRKTRQSLRSTYYFLNTGGCRGKRAVQAHAAMRGFGVSRFKFRIVQRDEASHRHARIYCHAPAEFRANGAGVFR